MEKRGIDRKIVSIKAKLFFDSSNYSVFIENMSTDGLYIVTQPVKTVLDFTKGKILKLIFHSSAGEEINLRCKVMWSYKTPPHGLTESIGMKIIDPPALYDEFYKTAT
jgi:hypothetical protein